MAEQISRTLAELYPDDPDEAKTAALMIAVAQKIAQANDGIRDDREKLEHYGRTFDRILLMELSDADC